MTKRNTLPDDNILILPYKNFMFFYMNNYIEISRWSPFFPSFSFSSPAESCSIIYTTWNLDLNLSFYSVLSFSFAFTTRVHYNFSASHTAWACGNLCQIGRASCRERV